MNNPLALAAKHIYSGTSGLVVPIARSLFPPEYAGKSRLAFYAGIYNSIEINSSFYKMPQASTLRKWADDVPEYFRFTFKLLKSVTHCKALEYDAGELEKFIHTINNVGYKKGCLLIQFPPGFKVEHYAALENLMEDIIAFDPERAWNLSVELRNTSWYIAELFELLEYYKASLVIQDLPASATPLHIQPSGFNYFRFHGPGGKYRGSYSITELQAFSREIEKRNIEGKNVYVYFNNTMGDALNNINLLNGILSGY